MQQVGGTVDAGLRSWYGACGAGFLMIDRAFAGRHLLSALGAGLISSAWPVADRQLTAQPRPVVVASTPSCQRCNWEVSKLVRIGRASDSVVPIRGSQLLRTSKGEYLVAPVSTLGAIAVYDSSGRLLRTIGRRGPGPGEFGDITGLFLGAGDSV